MSHERGWPFSIVDWFETYDTTWVSKGFYEAFQHGRGDRHLASERSPKHPKTEDKRKPVLNEAAADGTGIHFAAGTSQWEGESQEWDRSLSLQPSSGFYLQLFLLIYLIFILVVSPPALVVGSLWILVTEGAFVLAGIGVLAAAIGFAVIWWLQAGDNESRPAVS